MARSVQPIGDVIVAVPRPALQPTETPDRATLPDLIRRRQEIMENLWSVEDKSAADSPEVLATAGVVVENLSHLIRDWESSPEANAQPLETGRTFRYFGDALFSLSAKNDKAILTEAREAYRRGEPPLQKSGEQLELAKLNFHLANTLRCLAEGRDRALMEEAKRRYNEARHIFQREKPEVLDLVESSLESLEIQLGGLQFYETAEQGRNQAVQLKEMLENAALGDTATDEKVSRAMTEMKASRVSPEAQLDQFRSFIEQTVDLLPISGAEDGPAKIRAELDALAAKISDGKPREEDEMFSMLFTELEKASGEGELTPQRQAALRATLEQFQALVREPANTPDEMVSRLGRLRGMISESKHIFVEPKTRTGRAAQIDRAFAAMRSFLMDQMNQSNLGQTEHKIAFELFAESSQVRRDLANAEENDAAVLGIEHDQLRRLAYRLRRFGLRHHLMLAEPMWGWPDVEVNPNSVFFAGSDEVREKVVALCGERRLHLAQESVGWGAGQVRWNRLRESAIGIFDLTMASPAERASVCHALGSALALGVYPVVVVNTTDGLPFDIDLKPVELAALSSSLDEALFAIHATTGVSSIQETVRQALGLVTREDATSRMIKKRLAESETLTPSMPRNLLTSCFQ